MAGPAQKTHLLSQGQALHWPKCNYLDQTLLSGIVKNEKKRLVFQLESRRQVGTTQSMRKTH